jgi:hypothetical protein
MRKIIIFLLGVFIFAPIITQGQVPNSVNSELKEFEDTIYNSTQKIIKINEQTTIVLAKRRQTDRYAFYLVVEGANTTQLTELPDDFIVNDMKLFDGYVYFCGQVGNKRGMIGRVSVNTLCSSSLNTIEWDKIANTTTLNKLEIYKDTTNTYTHIVAIGNEVIIHDTVYDSNYVNNKLTIDTIYHYHYKDIFLHSYEGNNWNYEIDAINNSIKSGIREYFSDLTVNKNYVVVGGFYMRYDTNNVNPTHVYLSIRNYDKYNIPTISPNIYRYDYTANNLNPLFNKLVLRTIDDNDIAIAATIQFNQYTFGLVGEYNTLNPSSFNNIQLNGYIDTTKTEIKDISYNPIDHKLSVLELTRTTAQPDEYLDYVFELDFSQSSYYANILGSKYLFNSIVEYKPSYYAAVGMDIATNNMVVWDRNRSYTAYTNCDHFFHGYIWSTNITLNLNSSATPSYVSNINFYPHIVGKLQIPININCKF